MTGGVLLYVGLVPLVPAAAAAPLVIAELTGRTTVSGGVRLLGIPPPTTTGVTVRLLVVDGIGALNAAGDPPPVITGVTVTPDAVVIPVTATVAVVVAEFTFLATGVAADAGLATFSLDLSLL